jgi:alpha-amylase/alpha-mannosidase (GH57 family)
VKKYICIHGHFYQPPRENPWLEAIELQDSAYPYHDWNERVAAESYAPNAASRILDGENQIVKIVNNYARISFDFGPTLLCWLQEKAPDIYGAIIEADREGQKNFSGHGTALAQAYNHMILPLANRRDKYTQILWGIQDFERRFGRQPEGMWLPETAVDLESLEILAELGIRFTILSPHQASRVRRLGGRTWRDVSGDRIDPTMVYEQRLPSGHRIALFFYDGPVSRAVAFEGLLLRGENLAGRLLGAFRDGRDWDELVHIATDGETYGHHHRYGEMALSYALDTIESNNLAKLTNYGEYLEKHPPTHQVEILENTAWSCAHGVERWKSNCGCNSGGHPDWQQKWRTPLREALDWLRETLVPRFEKKAGEYLKDPWAARDDYIHAVLDRSPENVQAFLERHAARSLADEDKITALKLLELQRHAMLMYTSCGWFFDELSGIETVQIIHYAGRAVQLGQEIFGDGIEAQFAGRLAAAKSNIPEHRDGRTIYEKLVKTAMVDWEKVGAHYGVSSMFEDYTEQTKIYCYLAEREDYQSFEAGKARLVVGRVKLTSEITREQCVLSFGVLHFGDHNLNGGVQKFLGEDAYRGLVEQTAEPFMRADFPEVLRLMDRNFGESNYSIRSLFRDEQRKILGRILETTLAEAEATYRRLYENHAPMMRFLTDLRIPLPRAFQAAAEFVLNGQLRRALEHEEIDSERVGHLLDAARLEGVTLDTATLEYAFRHNLERIAEQFLAHPTEPAIFQRLQRAADLAQRLPFKVNLWTIQNRFYRILETVCPEEQAKADEGDEAAHAWVDRVVGLGRRLGVRVS